MCVTANQAIFNGLKNTFTEKKGRDIERKEEVKKKKKKERKKKVRENDKHSNKKKD